MSTIRIVGAVRDARGQRAREAELEDARVAAEQQNAGKSRFLANMSHELRTPLNAIMGFSDIMRQRLFGPMSDRYSEYAELIHESGAHLLELINDVLDMSKIEAERFELSREDFDARDAISAVLRLMRGQADRAGITLRGSLPAVPLEAAADRRAVKQIAMNLLSNALKFTPRGGMVTISARGDGRVLEIVVTDTGVGIAGEDLTRLGRPFEQAGGAEQRQAGSGLGLSLVRAFARLHGGDMEIASVVGEGTTITVRMPVLAPAGQIPLGLDVHTDHDGEDERGHA
jgi:cell cycle sensor histidine kinase DivJ